MSVGVSGFVSRGVTCAARLCTVGFLLAAGSPLAHAQAVPPAPAAPHPAPPTAADIAFLQDMIGHHAQALRMAALVPARSEVPALRTLAERLSISQQDEIATMSTWLRDHRVPVSAAADAHAAHHVTPDTTRRTARNTASERRADTGTHAMPGMLTEAQFAELAEARGGAFDRLFLRFMIQHHEGALVMVRTLLATPNAARDPQLFQLVSDVDTDQRAEIRRMRALLATLPS